MVLLYLFIWILSLFLLRTIVKRRFYVNKQTFKGTPIIIKVVLIVLFIIAIVSPLLLFLETLDLFGMTQGALGKYTILAFYFVYFVFLLGFLSAKKE